MGFLDGKNGNGQQPQQQPSADKKVYRYRCKANCTYKGSYRKEGDIIESPVELKVPHFVLVEEKKE